MVLNDIRAKAKLILDDEQKARADFLKYKEQISAKLYNEDKKSAPIVIYFMSSRHNSRVSSGTSV